MQNRILARIIHKLSAAGPLSSLLTALPTLRLLSRVQDYARAALGRKVLSARRLRPFASIPCELRGLAFLLVLVVTGCGKNLDQQMKESIRNLDNAQLKKDEIEILDVQQSGDLTIAEVKIQTALKLRRVGESWHLEEIRLGDRRWEKADVILAAISQQREQIAGRQLADIQSAIESYRSSYGELPAAEDFQQLIDALSPLYLTQVIRLDPWSRGFYFHRISEATYDLRSAGPDGEFQTADDIRRGASPQ